MPHYVLTIPLTDHTLDVRYQTEDLGPFMATIEDMMTRGVVFMRLTWWEVRMSSCNAGCLLCQEQISTQNLSSAREWAEEHTCKEVRDE